MGPTLKVLPPEACLISEILNHFGSIESHSWSSWGVILPTQRLATMVLAGLSMKRRALTPPRHFNLESLVDTLLDSTGCNGAGNARLPTYPPSLLKPLMPGLAQECLLASLIQSQGFKFLRLGHEHEVVQLFNEITLWDRAREGWTALKESVRQNTFLSEGSLDTLSLRCSELEQLYLIYSETLEQCPSLPSSARLAARTQWLGQLLVQDKLPKSPLLPEKLLFAGLTSLNPLLTGILQKLVQNPTWGPASTLLLSQPPGILSSQNPLQKLFEALHLPAGGTVNLDTSHRPRTPDPLPKPLPKPPPHPFRVLVAPDPMAEVQGVLTQAHLAIANGLAPSSIAILVTDDHMYGNYLNMLMPHYAGPFNVALQTALETTVLGRWFQSLIDWLRYGAGPGDLGKALSYLTHPLVERRSQGGTRDHLLYAMDSYCQKAETSPQWSGFVQHLCSHQTHPGWTKLGLDVSERLAPWLSRGDIKPFQVWTRAFRELVAGDLPLGLDDLPENYFNFDNTSSSNPSLSEEPPISDGEDIGIRMASYQSLVDFLATLDSLADMGSPEVSAFPVSQKEFLAVVQRLFRTLKVHSTGDPLYGIQVLSLAEARFVPFELVFILGATEGQFPRALPVDHVLDNTLKTKLGLPGWQLLEAIEDTTFYLLRSRIPRLVLSYPDQSGTAVRSRFIEMALVLGEAQLERLSTVGEQILPEDHQNPPISPRSRDMASTDLGWIDATNTGNEILATQSAFSLSNLLQCPYRFFLDRCGVRSLDIDQDRRSRLEGKALHRVLEIFFQETACAPEIPPLPKIPPEEPWPDFFSNRFRMIAAAVLPEEIKASPLFLHMELKGWSDLGTFLADLLGWSTLGSDHTKSDLTTDHSLNNSQNNYKAWTYLRHTKHEQAFKSTVALDTQSVDLIGRIDGLFPTPWGQVIIDYKRKGLPPKSQATLGDAPQLLVYALATQSTTLPQTMVGYYSLLEGRWLGISAGSDCPDHGSGQRLLDKGKNDLSLEEIIAQFKNRLNKSYQAILGTAPDKLHFRAQPWRCNDCSYHGICRREELTDAPQ